MFDVWIGDVEFRRSFSRPHHLSLILPPGQLLLCLRSRPGPATAAARLLCRAGGGCRSGARGSRLRRVSAFRGARHLCRSMTRSALGWGL